MQTRTKVLLPVFALSLLRNISGYLTTPTPIALRHFLLKSLKNSRAKTRQNRNPRLPPIQINPATLRPNHSTLNSCPCPITQFLKIPKPLYPCRSRLRPLNPPCPSLPLSASPKTKRAPIRTLPSLLILDIPPYRCRRSVKRIRYNHAIPRI